MTAYLKIDNVKGNVTTSGHEGAIECLSASFSVNQSVNSKTGIVANRTAGIPGIGELRLKKYADKSSVRLFEYACNGKVIPKATLVYCQTGGKVITYSKHIMTDVFVTRYHEGYDEISEHSLEFISLNFSKIEKTFYPRNSQNEAMSPITAGYDKATGTTT